MLTEKQCFLCCTDRKRCYGAVAAAVTVGGGRGTTAVSAAAAVAGDGGHTGGGSDATAAATRPLLARPTNGGKSTDACPAGRLRPSNLRRPTTTSAAVQPVTPSRRPSIGDRLPSGWPTVGGARWWDGQPVAAAASVTAASVEPALTGARRNARWAPEAPGQATKTTADQSRRRRHHNSGARLRRRRHCRRRRRWRQRRCSAATGRWSATAAWGTWTATICATSWSVTRRRTVSFIDGERARRRSGIRARVAFNEGQRQLPRGGGKCYGVRLFGTVNFSRRCVTKNFYKL